MFITDQLVYLQLEKTGCTHISHLLSKICSGQQVGKHNHLPQHLQNSDKYIVGSIRNPWDWYVSLWAYGCDHEGGLYNRLTSRKFRMVEISRNLVREPLNSFSKILFELRKNNQKWHHVYSDVNNPNLFREWLYMVLNPSNKIYLGENYEQSNISHFAGLFTFRYLRLFLKDPSILYYKQLSDIHDIKKLDASDNVLDYIIYNETLEEDLKKVLEQTEVVTSTKKVEHLFSSKQRTNSSSRNRDINSFYDSETIELVREKEKFIINKYNYDFPYN